MQYIVNTQPTYKIEQCIEGNFLELGSKIILAENSIFLFCRNNKLVKIKHFYSKIIQIAKLENKINDLLIILFPENRVSYLSYDLENNDFKVQGLKYFNCDSYNPLIRISLGNGVIKLNRYEFSYLNEERIDSFMALHKDLVNVVDILFINETVPTLVVLIPLKCFVFCSVLLKEFEFDEPCFKIIKISSFFCVVGKYSIYFIKNGILYKIASNIFKVEYLDEEIIRKIKLGNESLENEKLGNESLENVKLANESLENINSLVDLNCITKINYSKEFEPQLEDVKTKGNNSTELNNNSSFYSWKLISSQKIYKTNTEFFINADLTNSHFAAKDTKMYILYNNKLTIIELNFNKLIIFDYKISIYLAPTSNIDFFCVTDSQIILNNWIYDLNLNFVNLYFEKVKNKEIEEPQVILEYKNEDLIYKFTKSRFSLYNKDFNELGSCNFYFRKIIFQDFLFVLCKDLIIKNAYTFETTKKIKEVDNFDVKEVLCVVKGGFIFLYKQFKLICSAFLNDFQQSILINFSEESFLIEEVFNSDSSNIFDNLIADCNYFDEKCFIKELIVGDDFFLMRSGNDVLILYRKIENYFVKVTVNHISLLNEQSFFEDEKFIFILGRPNLVLNKQSFLISKLVEQETQINFQNGRTVEKFLNLSAGKIQIETENAIFYKERFENDSDDEDCIDVGAISKKFYISFYHSSYFINEYELLPDEFVTNLKEMTLNDLQSKNNKSNFLIIATTFVKSEESFFRGRILLFEVINVVPEENKIWTSKRLKILAIEKAKAPVLDLCEVRGFISCCVGTKLLIYEQDRNYGLNCIAFHDTNVLAVRIDSIKNYILIGDLKGLLFFYFQTKPAKIHLLGSEQISTKEIQIYTYKSQLFFITQDLVDKVRVFTYSPYNYLSKDGIYLIKRVQFDALYPYFMKISEDLYFYEEIVLKIENTAGINLKEELCIQSGSSTVKNPQFSFVFYEFFNFDLKKQKSIVGNVRKVVHRLAELLN